MLKENYKLRKMKIGLVSTAAAAIFVISNGTAEASEDTTAQEASAVSVDEKQVNENQQVEDNTASEQAENESFIHLDEVRPGDTQVSGYTQPNKAISLKIDNKDVVNLEDDFQEVVSDENGKFTYDLNGRKIVYNQKVDVEATEPLDLDALEDDEEALEASDEENDLSLEGLLLDAEGEGPKASYTTPRYEKAYEIPETRLPQLQGNHQVWIEPILEGTGVVKGHTSVKGKVALAINGKFINLGDSASTLEQLSKEAYETRYDGIWKFIDPKGFFEFEFNRLFDKSYALKKGDLVSLSFKSDNEQDTMPSFVFNVLTEPFETVEKAHTLFDHNAIEPVKELKDVDEAIQINDIFGDVIETAIRGEDKLILEGTKEMTGRTKYANALIRIDSNLGEYRHFPTLQADQEGNFTFNIKEAGYRMYNGETLTLTVVDPTTQKTLAQIEKYIEPVDIDEIMEDEVFDDYSDEDDDIFEIRSFKPSNEVVAPKVEEATKQHDEAQQEKVKQDTQAAVQHETAKETDKNDASPAVKAEQKRDASEHHQASAETPKMTQPTSVTKTTMPEHVTPASVPSQGENEQAADASVSVESDFTQDMEDMVPYRQHLATLKLVHHDKGSVGHVNGLQLQSTTPTTPVDYLVKPHIDKVQPKSVSVLPETGQEKTSTLWSLLLMVSGVSLLAYKRRKQQKHTR
ncbi:LPXTG cell wall anchor domain-containing protein [Staphylococcus coagulans]|uniref:LPXTG cell wall anchor domain-containing protein n=1 Tax=Staphylococcus coagulans TaxID=74706 RepID=UPI001BED37EE|nr:LPXTG cell wall anchor domain-containing protein [Staphylococcus coagulans]MBT2846740.1 LPXTG cell wall anchor domain-containing protein [Staphylococcus coagulans]